jgi:transcriptional regulator with GAF, ATPase, and Fis domain
METREVRLVQTFVEVADTLVADFDVVELLTSLANHCVELFDASEAGLLLTDRNGGLEVVASSSSAMASLELFELQHDEGPCIDCFHTGQLVSVADLEADRQRWPRFASEALDAGFHAACAVPMRLRDSTIGALNLLRTDIGTLSEAELAAAQALADVATIGLIYQRAAEDARLLTEQLQGALDSRIVIEQAKGVLAAQGGLSMTAAFEALRRYARAHQERLSDVAAAVVTRDPGFVDQVAGAAPPETG